LDAAQAQPTTAHQDALQHMQQRLADFSQTPSAQLLEQVRCRDDASYVGWVKAQSAQHQQWLLAQPWSAAQQQHFEMLAQQSLKQQIAIEKADTLPFELYRQQYVSLQSI
jgi:glutamate--cysteine ligase